MIFLKLKANIEAVKPWLNMDVPGATTGTEKYSVYLCSFPEILLRNNCISKSSQMKSFPKASDVRIFYSDKNQTCVAGFCMKKMQNSLRKH